MRVSTPVETWSFALLGSLVFGAWSFCRADFPAPYNSEKDTNSTPLPPLEAAAKMKLPPGFKATVFAAEPDVQNPIAMAWDARGRLWIAENYTYAERPQRFDLQLRDRILIFEDKDGDGRFDSRKVFTDDVQMLTSIEVGFGGVWLMCPPQVLFIPDRDGDDKPDAPAEVVIDGFKIPPENYHNFANGLRFGPDGWLYGRCGASCPGELGVTGTPMEQRVPMRGTMWRYHPQRKVVEVLSGGCTNPWGHDWNEHGELFFINTVNGQLWHQIPGAHYVRPHTIDPNPRAYALIDQHADHWHFDTAQDWSKSRDGAANVLGGGHAHIGMMVYLGDNWPAEYHGRLFTLNFHGRRANQEILERSGSGYVGRHGADLCLAEDKWFRGMELSYGPDGGVFVLDWSDTGECHESTGVHRASGRIFKITYGDPKRPAVGDLARLDSRELVKLQLHPNEWFARQARLQLAERAAAGRGLEAAQKQLREMFERDTDVVHKLRALWSLQVIGAADEKFLTAQLHHENEHVRAWAVRLLSEWWAMDTTLSERRDPFAGERPIKHLGKGDVVFGPIFPDQQIVDAFVQLAEKDSSALVRLVLASTLQRLGVNQRSQLAAALVAHKEDANDHNLPLMIWYGLIPVADTNPSSLTALLPRCELPMTRRFIARRLAEDIEKNPQPVNLALKLIPGRSEAFQSDILAGVAEGLTGWRKATKPEAWDSIAKQLANAANTVIRDRVRELSVVFGDGRALDEVKKVALDPDADLNARKAALQTLIDARAPDLRPICEKLLGVRFLNPVAARGLATFDDPAIGEALVKAHRSFHGTERPQLLAALVSRPAFARTLLDAVGEGKIPRAEVSAFHARQIHSFNDAALNEQLARVWGEMRDSPEDKRRLIAKLKTQLTREALAHADKGQGRALFSTLCAACHTLYGQGGQVGPDLTGAGRDNLDYLLDNLVDPSAVVNADFHMSVVNLKDGRVLNGLVSAQTGRTLTLKTMTEVATVERTEIESIQESSLSLMPEGLLEALNEVKVRDLIAYLMSPQQVPLPAENASGK